MKESKKKTSNNNKYIIEDKHCVRPYMNIEVDHIIFYFHTNLNTPLPVCIQTEQNFITSNMFGITIYVISNRFLYTK